MLDIQNRRVQLGLFIAGLLILSLTAEKFRELVGEEASSKSGKYTYFDCFDMGSGSLACVVKEGVKLYAYNFRNAHVEKARHQAIEIALTEALSEGLSTSAAAKLAQTAGAKSAKLASRQAKRIIGPIISSGWDFFEAIYFEGTLTEGFLRGTGTLFGTFVGGFYVEEGFGKFGYLVGSELGSWVGGRMGLMVYDVIYGLGYLLQVFEIEENIGSGNSIETNIEYEDSGNEAEYREEERRTDYETNIEYEDSEAESRRAETVEYYEKSTETVQESPEASEGWGFL